MRIVEIALPDELFGALHKSPDEVAREMRIAVAVRWYAQGLVSQGRGAEIAGLSRADFVDALSVSGVSPFQETLEDVREALAGE
jgi:predicted HTH domain antitoxin